MPAAAKGSSGPTVGDVAAGGAAVAGAMSVSVRLRVCTGGDLQVIAAGSGAVRQRGGGGRGRPSVPYTMSGSVGAGALVGWDRPRSVDRHRIPVWGTTQHCHEGRAVTF
ncbi:hypothetical protein GCM10009654_27930 [Streptomyces hebeiensis]|uniref:Uncharacterized protein n=1 Tax=Streptomyces hebeiensis TaxID=229486 RepID=A0ABN1UTY0_9ACTN